MSVAIKLLIERTEDAIAAATTPAERTRLGRDLAAYKGTLAAAHAAPRATRDPEAPAADADEEATKTCSGCGEVADEGDAFCASCGKKLPTDEDDDEPEASFAPFKSQADLDAAAAHVQRDALVGYADHTSGTQLKVGDLKAFAKSQAARRAAGLPVTAKGRVR